MTKSWKTVRFLIVISTAMLVASSGFTACNSNSSATIDSIASTDHSLEPVPTSMPSEPSSAEFTLQASSSDTDIDLDADNTSTTEQLTFDVYSSTQLDLTGALQVTTGSESPSLDLQKTNPVYLAYQNTPSNITYNGYSTINYTIGGSSYSTALNTQQVNMLDEIQQELDQAGSYNTSSGRPTPVVNSLSTAGANNGEIEKPLEEMTDNEIKKWLKEKGYKVKELGNRTSLLPRMEKFYLNTWADREDSPKKTKVKRNVIVLAGFYMVALDRLNGEVNWKTYFPEGGFDVGLATTEESAYAASIGTFAAKVDLKSGKKQWVQDIRYSNTSIPTVQHGRLYFNNSGGGGIWVLNTMDGSVIYNEPPPNYRNDSFDVYISSLGISEGYMVNIGSKAVYCLKVP